MTVKYNFKETERLLDKAVEAGLTAVGITILNDAQANVHDDLGQLEDSINYKVRKEKTGDSLLTIGTALFYAPFVEFGTGIYEKFNRGRKTAWTYFDERRQKFFRTRGQKPNPFMRKAFDENRKNIVPIFSKQFKRVLK